MYLAVGSDNLLWLLGLCDNLAGDAPTNYVTGATVTATILSADGATTIATVTLAYVSGQATVNGKAYAGGNYRGQLTAAQASLLSVNKSTNAARYIVQIVATAGGNTLTKRVPLFSDYDGIV